MDFWQTVVVLLRRWYIAVPAFFASLALAGAAYAVIPVAYDSGAVLVLTTPLSGGTTRPHAAAPASLTNPLLSFDPSLNLTAAIVIQQMNSTETAAELGLAPGSAATYAVTNGSTNPELLESGPFIFIEGTGRSPQEARTIANKVAQKATRVLAERQAELKAPASTLISMEVVVAPSLGRQLSGSRKRAAAAALALAGIGGLAATYGFENLVTHRRLRRTRREASVR